MELTYMKVAFIEYLKDKDILPETLPTPHHMMKAAIPYLAKHVKWWAKVDPERVRMTHMK